MKYTLGVLLFFSLLFAENIPLSRVKEDISSLSVTHGKNAMSIYELPMGVYFNLGNVFCGDNGNFSIQGSKFESSTFSALNPEFRILAKIPTRAFYLDYATLPSIPHWKYDEKSGIPLNSSYPVKCEYTNDFHQLKLGTLAAYGRGINLHGSVSYFLYRDKATTTYKPLAANQNLPYKEDKEENSYHGYSGELGILYVDSPSLSYDLTFSPAVHLGGYHKTKGTKKLGYEYIPSQLTFAVNYNTSLDLKLRAALQYDFSSEQKFGEDYIDEDYSDSFTFFSGAEYTLHECWSNYLGFSYTTSPCDKSSSQTPFYPKSSILNMQVGTSYVLPKGFDIALFAHYAFNTDTQSNTLPVPYKDADNASFGIELKLSWRLQGAVKKTERIKEKIWETIIN